MTKQTKIGIAAIAGLVILAAVLSSLGPPMQQQSGLQLSIPDMNQTSGLPVLSQSMPQFQGISRWWNTPDGQPLTPEKLKGKVVLIDFWTYSCINCLRTLPFLRSLQTKYADKGLVIVGVHTPEFDFEGKAENVDKEIKKLGLLYPIALDAEHATWLAYNNRYWPAEYLFDAQGRLRHTHFGEGAYDETENDIRQLLLEGTTFSLPPADTGFATPDFSEIGTSETYFGLKRQESFQGSPRPSAKKQAFVMVKQPNSNDWSVGGTWSFTDEYALAEAADDTFSFNVKAAKLHLVLDSADGTDKRIRISVDGAVTQTMTINESTLYTVAEFADGGRHTVTIEMLDAGVRFYSATFS